MQTRFFYYFPLPLCPHTLARKHPLTKIGQQTTFHFFGVGNYFQDKLSPQVNKGYLPTPSSSHNAYTTHQAQSTRIVTPSMWLQTFHPNCETCHLNLPQILSKEILQHANVLKGHVRFIKAFSLQISLVGTTQVNIQEVQLY